MEGENSFIPRKNVLDPNLGSGQGVGLFSLIAIALFIVVAAGVGGLFLYHRVVKAELEQKQQELTEFEQTLNDDIVKEIKTVAARLSVAQSKLAGHVGVSVILGALEQHTLRSVRWTDFRFENSDDGSLTATISGEAAGFGSVALQGDELAKLPIFKNISISDLNRDSRGLAVFTLRSSIDFASVSYRETINKIFNSNSLPAAIVTPSVSTSTFATSTSRSGNATSTSASGQSGSNSRSNIDGDSAVSGSQPVQRTGGTQVGGQGSGNLSNPNN